MRFYWKPLWWRRRQVKALLGGTDYTNSEIEAVIADDPNATDQDIADEIKVEVRLRGYGN